MSEHALYDYAAQRGRYLPRDHVKVLFVGESAPDPAAKEPRFFYHPVLTAADNLFRGIMLALYGAAGNELLNTPKQGWLARFQADGYFLEDLCPLPVNYLPQSERSKARRAGVRDLIVRIKALSPAGIIVCHAPTYRDLAGHLRANGLPLLHEQPVPFPLDSHRARFVEGVRAALAVSK